MRAPWLVLVVAAAGCSKILGIDDLSGPNSPGDDAGPGGDGSVDGPIVPEMIKVSGRIERNLATPDPLRDYPIKLVKMPGRVTVAMGVTDSVGNFMLMAPTGGAPLAVHLEIAGNAGFDFATSFQHFDGPLVEDARVDLGLNSNTSLTQSASSSGDPRQQTTAMVRVFVAAADGATPLAGAVVTLAPSAPVKYLGTSVVLPDGVATGDRGVAFAFNASVGENTASAEIGGAQLAHTFPIFAAGESHYVTLRRP